MSKVAQVPGKGGLGRANFVMGKWVVGSVFAIYIDFLESWSDWRDFAIVQI